MHRFLCGALIALSSVAAQGAELGVFRWNSPDGPTNVDNYSTWLGTSVATPTAFEARTTWDQITGEAWNLQPWSQWVKAKPGRNISLAVAMLPSSGASLSSCAAGQYDAYWTKLANNLAYYGLHWAYLRLGWEMDGNWYAWNAPQGSGKEASYAGCFRRVVQVMRQAQPANQWKFVLNLAMSWSSKSYLDAIWPGDAYVDVVAWDYYDQSWASNTYPYPSTCDSACRLTRQQNAWNANATRLYALRDHAVAHGKKMAFPEWAVFTTTSYPNSGGDNPYYIQKMYDFISDPANNVAFHAYFDVTYTGFNGQLSGSTTSFPKSAALFKKLFGPTTTTSNTAPTVSIASPSAGQTVSGTIAYAANATDNAGVSRVDFSVDSTALVSDSAAPYGGSLDTTKLANGTHVLKAVAYDAQGLSAASQVSINVQNTATSAPTVSFKAPASGATLSGSYSDSTSCEVTGTGLAKVVFFLDTTQLNVENYSPWQCKLDTRQFSNGTHTLRAVGYNSAGASASVSRSVNISNTFRVRY